jgi:putative hydrolase of the HAD superfamily
LWETVGSDVFASLRRFRAAGLRLVVVSNANGRLGHVLDRLGLRPHVDVVLDSHEVGFEKPDPRLFELALVRSGAQRETTLHIGDFYHVDVVGARSAGLQAVLLDAHDLQSERDCARVPSLAALADQLTGGSQRGWAGGKLRA